MKLSLVILAGGLGKRLGQITKKVPKALIDISGKPFISRQLDYLKYQGFQNLFDLFLAKNNLIAGPEAPRFNLSKFTIFILNFPKRNLSGVRAKYDKCS